MSISKRSRSFFWACMAIAIFSFLLVILLSGAQHETKKFKTLLITIVLVLMICFLLFDGIYFMVISSVPVFIKKTSQLQQQELHASYSQYEPDYRPNRSDFLRLRIESLRAQIQLPAKHRIESENIYFKDICWDLWLFARYFVLLLLIVVGSRETLTYYNTYITKTALYENRLGSVGVKKIKKIEDVYNFAEVILVNAFSEGRNYQGDLINEPGWINLEIAKLLGVVRLRQVRYTNKIKGLGETRFTEQPFLPQWSLPYIVYHYLDKYWRIYDPWVTLPDEAFSLLLPLFHMGNVHYYPEYSGYVAVLGRNKQNSLEVLEFLRENHWLDDKTSAVFVDFTLYNVDSNIFSIVNIMLEQTPFGGVLSYVEVYSAQLLFNVDMLSYWGLLVLFLYVLMLVQFAKILVLKAWHDKHFLSSAWNIVDCCILLLNALLLIMICLRELYVKHLLQVLAESEKLVFVDFRKPGQIDYLTLIAAGFLVALTTIRIWKIMQFAAPFMIFTRTLSKAFTALAAILGIIIMFLCAFCISIFIINSNNSEVFLRLIRSFSTAMCFSFGFSSEAKPTDLNHGGTWLGTAFYIILMISVSIFLINVFLTLIADYCTKVKEVLYERLQMRKNMGLNFGSFVAMEYRWLMNMGIASRKKYKESHEVDTSDISNSLRKYQETKQSEEFPHVEETSSSDSNVSPDELRRQRKQDASERIEKLRLIALVLTDEQELLDREFTKLDVLAESDDDNLTPRPMKSKNYDLIAVGELLLSELRFHFACSGILHSMRLIIMPN